jgi:hypothetical protein
VQGRGGCGISSACRARPVPDDYLPHWQELRVVEVGVFTTSFKGLRDRPKSRSSVRRVPLAAPAVEAIARHVPPNAGPSTIVFTGPGGGSGLAKGAGQG